MTTDTQAGLTLVLDLGMAPLNVAAAYCAQLERCPTTMSSQGRALSRAVNTVNAQLFNLGLQTMAVFQAVVRHARKLGIPESVLSTVDAALAQQEATLLAMARKTVHLAYAH